MTSEKLKREESIMNMMSGGAVVAVTEDKAKKKTCSNPANETGVMLPSVSDFGLTINRECANGRSCQSVNGKYEPRDLPSKVPSQLVVAVALSRTPVISIIQCRYFRGKSVRRDLSLLERRRKSLVVRFPHIVF